MEVLDVDALDRGGGAAAEAVAAGECESAPDTTGTFRVSFSRGEGAWAPGVCEGCTKAASDRAERAKSVFKVCFLCKHWCSFFPEPRPKTTNFEKKLCACVCLCRLLRAPGVVLRACLCLLLLSCILASGVGCKRVGMHVNTHLRMW